MILHCMSVFYVFSNYSSTIFFRDLASAFIDVLILSITFWILVASSLGLIFVFKSLDVGRKYLWILENLSYWSAYFSAYISSRSSKLWPWCSSIMDHFEHNEILHSLQKMSTFRVGWRLPFSTGNWCLRCRTMSWNLDFELFTCSSLQCSHNGRWRVLQ